MVSRDLLPMRERMRPATMDRQAATDCGGWRDGHNGGDAASPLSGVKRKSDFGAVRAAFDPKPTSINLNLLKDGLRIVSGGLLPTLCRYTVDAIARTAGDFATDRAAGALEARRL